MATASKQAFVTKGHISDRASSDYGGIR